MRKLFFFLLILFVFTISGNTQVALYSFNQSGLTYTSMSGGTVLRDGLSTMDSWVSSELTIPSFTFSGTAYTTAFVTSNGQVTLGGTAPSTTTYTGISTGVGTGAQICICPFSADLDRATTTASSEIRWGTSGNEIIFQWTQIKRYGSSMAESFDMQVRLNTSTGVILFVYQLNSGPYASTSYQPQVGIRTSSTDYLNREVTTANNWNTSTAGTVNTANCRFNGTSPATNFTTGLTYSFTPPPVGTPLPPTTPSPANAATNIPVSGNLTWTFGTNTVTYDLMFGPSGSMTQVVTGGTAGATGSYTYSALNNSTTYQWQVIEHNGGLTTNGPIWSFTTACGSYPLNLVQGFNAGTIPNCWSTQLVTATGEKITFVTTASSQTASPQEGTHFVMFNSYSSTGGGSGAEERLISPAIVTTGVSSVNVEFYWFESGNTTYTNPAEGVQVEWSTNGSTWTNSTFYPRYVSTAPTTGAWVKKTITLPSGAGNIPTLYLSFKFHSTYGYNCYLDNLTVLPSPTCIEPTGLAVTAITNNSATLNWTASVTPPANGYDIYYSTSSTPPTSGTTPSATVLAGITTYNMTGLTPSTGYYVWVRSVCSGSDKSIWAGPVSFLTLCDAISSLPWSENFDGMTTIGNNILPTCWKMESPTGTPWTTANAGTITYNDPCSAPNYIYVNWSPYGAGIYKILITPGFNLYAGVNYSFKFNWVGDGTAGWAGDVLINTVQTATGATVIGTPFVEPATTTMNVCTEATYTFNPTTSGTYYFMVRANNTTLTPWDLGFDDFQLTGPPCTAPTALTATNITSTGATLGWTSTGTAWEYQYGPTGYTPTAAGNGTNTNPVQVTGLTPATGYDFYIRNNCTYSYSSWVGPSPFTTLAGAPTAVTLAATAITSTSATLNGTVNANGASTTITFDYGLTTSYGTNVAGVPGTATGNTVTASLKALTGLLPNTTYHFRINGVNSIGTSHGNDLTFTTSAVPPIVVTNAASLVTQTTATLNGTVTANNASTTISFEYGLTTSYGTTVSGVPATIDGNTAMATLANITGLTPSTLYHFRCKGTNSGGTTNGNDLTFTTPAPAVPTVVTNAATNTNLTIGTLNGTVTANGAATTVTFEYGLTTAYGATVNATPFTVNGNTPTTVSASLTGLTPLQTYHYRVVGVNSVGTSNGADMTFQTVCPSAGPAGPITGPANVCQGGSGYVYTVTIPSATGYVWTLPIGGTITSGANTNTITVSYAYNAAAGNLFVYGTAPCGNGAPSQLAVSVNPPANPSLSGPANACINVSGNVYSTQTGMTNYVWTVSPGGSITAGGTTTSSSATITWTTIGAKTVTVNYNNASGCSGLTAAVQNVTVNALPVPVITGPSPACTNFPGTIYSTESGMTGYVWTISAGGIINSGQGTNAISVTWNSTGAQTVSVNYTNASGCSAAAPVVKNVTVNTGANPTITGLTTVCVNSGYITYSTQAGMTGYNWTVSPGGVISFGSGTNSILVSWLSGGAQWVRVSYTNASGCAPATPTQLDVTVNPLPGDAGLISGTPDVCPGLTGVAYSVDPIQNSSTYVWTLPAGASIVSGAGTNAITVDFDATAVSGDITVFGNNVCGNGNVSPAYTIYVSTPEAPVITLIPLYTLSSNVPDGNQWYWEGTLIPGANSQTYEVTENGWYWDVVSVNGCTSDTSNHIFVLIEGVNNLTSGNFSIYPIPNDGKFNIAIYSSTQEVYTLNVYNSLGTLILENQDLIVNGKLEKTIDLRPVAPGIYSVILQNGKNHMEKKILISK